MNSIASIVIGVLVLLNAYRIKCHPETTHIRKPFRISSLWRREPFSMRGWKSKYYDDLTGNPELHWLYFVNNLVTGILFILSGVLAYFLGIDAAYFMLIAGVVSLLMFMIGRQRITGEVEVAKWVFLAVVLVLFIVAYFLGLQT